MPLDFNQMWADMPNPFAEIMGAIMRNAGAASTRLGPNHVVDPMTGMPIPDSGGARPQPGVVGNAWADDNMGQGGTSGPASSVNPNPPSTSGNPMVGPPMTAGVAAGIAQAGARRGQSNVAPGAGAASPSPDGTRAAGPPSSGGNGQMPGSSVRGGAMRYPTDNPQFALQSALLDKGVNPFMANHGIQMLMNSAPGLAQSFLMDNLGTTGAGVDSAGGEGAMFRTFLSNALGSANGVENVLSQSMNRMPSFLNMLSSLTDQKGQGMSVGQLNPFYERLFDQFMDPKGAAAGYGSLMTPFLSQNTGRAYTGGLTDIAGQALRREADDVTRGGTPRNFWDYLFGDL